MNHVQTYALIVAGLFIQSRPLPDAEAFRKDLPVIVDMRVVGNRALDGSLAHDPVLDQYTYKEQVTGTILDSKGKTRSSTIEVFDVTRSALTGQAYRRPVSKNGEPVSGKLPSKRVTSSTSVPPPVRDPVAEERDIQALYEIHANWSEPIDGHSVIALTLRPNARYKPKTDLGKWQQHFLIRAWLTAEGHEVIRQESEVITDIPAVRPVRKGTSIKLERRLINGEIWIPVRREFHAIGSFMPKGEQGIFVSEYSDFKKFVVDVELKP
jgi:hypothetical protein